MASIPSVGVGPAERLQQSSSRFVKAMKEFGMNFRVAMPGVIQEFDPVKQTCKVLPALTDVVRIQGQRTTIAIPILADVPVVLMRAGGFAVTMPIQQGDECLLVFGDQCIDAWWQSGAANGPQNQIDNRRHDLSDAFAIVGVWSQPRVLTDYSTDSLQIRSDDGETVIDVSAGQVTINAATVGVTSSGTVQVSAQTVQVSSQGDTTLNADNVTVMASGHVSVTAGGRVSIAGKDFLNHEHTGVAPGGGVSGPVA